MSEQYKHHTFLQSQAVDDAMADVHRLTLEIDVALNGNEGAAKQASLCDLVGQARDFGNLAREVKRQIDMRFKGRGDSYGGKKLWEQDLLWLANKALGQPTGKRPGKTQY